MLAAWRRRALRVLLATGAAAAVGAGCSAPSLLITPVSGKRELRESEILRETLLARDKIAVIDVSGVIVDTPRFALFGEGENPVSVLLEQLDKAARDGQVKAVVLRINSPGGTVTASELMHDEITHFRRTTGKPVIAHLVDVGASGGYYVACACDEIVAQRTTVTGSIGVIMQLFDVTGTMEMIGVQADAITSGPRKDAGSPFRALTEEERLIFQNIVDAMFEEFVRVVDAGRPNLTEEQVRTLADGRVYLAPQALEAGLIDRIGTFRQTLAAAKQRAGIERARVVMYHRPHEYRPNYYAQTAAAGLPAAAGTQVNLLNVNAAGLDTSLSPRFLYLWQPGTGGPGL